MLANHKVVAMVPTVDLDRARKFYADTLGFTVAEEQADEMLRFEFAEGTQLTVFRTREQSGSGHTEAGWEVDDLDAVVADLRDKGVELEEFDLGEEMPSEGGIFEMPGVGRGGFFRDPDGNVLSLFERA